MLWVSADGLRVVDDKTKVSTSFIVLVAVKIYAQTGTF